MQDINCETIENLKKQKYFQNGIFWNAITVSWTKIMPLIISYL